MSFCAGYFNDVGLQSFSNSVSHVIKKTHFTVGSECHKYVKSDIESIWDKDLPYFICKNTDIFTVYVKKTVNTLETRGVLIKPLPVKFDICSI